MSLPTSSTKIPNQKVVPIVVRIETYVNRYGNKLINNQKNRRMVGNYMGVVGKEAKLVGNTNIVVENYEVVVGNISYLVIKNK